MADVFPARDALDMILKQSIVMVVGVRDPIGALQNQGRPFHLRSFSQVQKRVHDGPVSCNNAHCMNVILLNLDVRVIPKKAFFAPYNLHFTVTFPGSPMNKES